MSPNSNDDLNDLIKKMQKGQQNMPPPSTPPPMMGSNISNVSMSGTPGATISKGISGIACCVVIAILASSLLPFIFMGGFFLNGIPEISNLMKEGFNMEGFEAMLVDGNADVPGDPASFDPIKNYESVRAFAGEGAQLISMDANLVRSDGTLELTASYKPSPTVDFRFMRELEEPPEDAAPLGAPGSSPDGKWYEPVSVTIEKPGQPRHVIKMGGGVNVEGNYTTKGMLKDVSSATGTPGKIVPAPTCSLADLWQIAIENGAPKDAVASIDYDERGYQFDITNVGNFDALTFSSDCKLAGEKTTVPEPAEIEPAVSPT